MVERKNKSKYIEHNLEPICPLLGLHKKVCLKHVKDAKAIWVSRNIHIYIYIHVVYIC